MAARQLNPTIDIDADFCVIGGGMAGLTAALAAARRGARVVLMHDRPVLGGNASSECRVHIGGADRHNKLPHLRETGILEELRLENCRRNPNREYSLWDLVLYDKARREPNLQLLLNCSCLEAETEGNHIVSVTGWQLTTYAFLRVKAKIFADCSGDAVLAPLVGAPFRVGREARAEYGESLAPEKGDGRTMGLTCQFQTRDYGSPQAYEPLDWARKVTSPTALPYPINCAPRLGYWWIELGGEDDSLRDTERLRDELLGEALGVWGHLKQGAYGAENRGLEWLQFLPAKRESRRYVGAHMLSQRDIDGEGKFSDTVAYGGWHMDDHDSAGLRAVGSGRPATVFHPTPSPYGIPYGSLYSEAIDNLMFAGRCHSATHLAMSSTRVMGTGCSMGQAVGTAAALACRLGVSPAEVAGRMRELQRQLLEDDCYLPGVRAEYPEFINSAALSASCGDPEPVRDGWTRQIDGQVHAWQARPGASVEYRFACPAALNRVELVLDSGLEKDLTFTLHYDNDGSARPPAAMPRRLELQVLQDGAWRTAVELKDNYQRRVSLALPVERAEGLRLHILETWGAETTRVYGFSAR